MNNSKFMDKIQKIFIPIGSKLSNQRHFSSISKALMATLPLTIIGAVSQIIANPPITPQMIENGGFFARILTPWFNFALQNKNLLMTPYNMTMGFYAVVIAFAVAYQLAKSYKMNGLMSGIVGMTMFVMVAAPFTNVTVLGLDGVESSMRVMSTTFLDAQGMFTAIIIALASVEISRMCERYNLVIKLPDVVPPSLSQSFSAMIPLLLNVLIIFGFNAIALSYLGGSIPVVISQLLIKPLSVANSVPGMFVIMIFASMLWTVGIHGTIIVYPLIMPLMIDAIMKNATLSAQGLPTVFAPVLLYSTLNMVGGTGNTLGLTLLSMRSKSKQLKAIGKVSIVPSLFGINEPVIFGVPIIFNPILAIPFVLSSIVISLLIMLAYSSGFMNVGHIMIGTLMPLGIAAGLAALSIRNTLFVWLMVPVTVLIYYPFFKVYEKQLVEQEELAMSESSETLVENV